MSQPSRSRVLQIVIVIIVLLALALLLSRCLGNKPAPAPDQQNESPASDEVVATASDVPATTPDIAEVLSPATIQSPQQVLAGSEFEATWSGPDNRDDYLTIVKPDAEAAAFGSYRETSEGSTLKLTAPIDAGTFEVRYVTGKSRTILARSPIEVVAAEALIDAPAEVTLGAQFNVTWSGPNNSGDYITIVPPGAADDVYGNYSNTTEGSPLKLTAPTLTGTSEVRYVSGQGRRVLARRVIEVLEATVTLSAPDEAVAGSLIEVTWTGPNNSGDYLTLVSRDTEDGKFGNYANTSGGSPLKLLMPIMSGDAEIRYMTGQGHRVLQRRAIRLVDAEITLTAPASGAAGTTIEVTWTGPNNSGDYITIVPADTPDGRFAAYENTTAGTPLRIKLPAASGPAEIRYMSGQGHKVLARRAIEVTHPE